MRRIRLISVFMAVILFLLAGCSSGSGSGYEESDLADESVPSGWFFPRWKSEPLTPYEAPPLRTSEFHEEAAEGDDNVKIDLSAASDGYIGISARSPKRLKFQVLKDDSTYTYDIASDGTPSIFPLQSGSGEYDFRVMENIEGTKYARIYHITREIEIPDEFSPFLRPSSYVPYDESSDCVIKAREFAATVSDEIGVIKKVYDYITKTVTYDTPKSETVKSGYLPDPDETMRTGKGICFDYASLAAAMLRSQGIPTRMIFGYVAPDGLYHAWNQIYVKKTGWITVSFELKEGLWTRVDLTFSAGGTSASFIKNGENYTDLYFY